MKKIFFLLAIVTQFSIAQTNPISGEYISVEKPTSGINLIINNDNTYHLAIFSGKYKIENDSIYFENRSDEYDFDLKFEKGKSSSKEITIFSEPTSVFNFMSGIHLGVQEKENGPIVYKSLNEYFDKDALEEYNEDLYNAEKSKEDKKISFSLPRPYALYFVKDKKTSANIEKYIIPSDVVKITVETNSNIFRELDLSGKLNEDKSLTIAMGGKDPITFQNRSNLPKSDFEKPISKSRELNWTYKGKKEGFDMYADSTAVDTAAYAYDEDYGYRESDYKFSVKVETNFEDAIKNLKSKYLVLYYNPKSKNQQKEFDEIIEEYNSAVSYDMYDGYNEEYDKFNFYNASSKDEKLLKANGITKFPVAVILDDKKQVLATYKGRYDDLATEVNKYDFPDKIVVAQRAKQVDEMLSAKTVDNAKLLQVFIENKNSYYDRFFDIPYNKYVDDYVIPTDTVAAVSDDVVVAENYSKSKFEFYSIKTSQVVFNQKLKDIFTSYQAKKIVDENLIGVLLNEVLYDYNSQKFFNKENSISKDDAKKYLAYAINYDADKFKKIKILNDVAMYIMNLEDKKDAIYEEISKNIMIKSNYSVATIKPYLEVVSHKNSEVDAIVNIINQLYAKVNANNMLFDNLNTEYEEMNEIYERVSEWNDLKNYYGEVFASASQYILKHKATSKYNDVKKWLDFANTVSKNNIQVYQALYDYNVEIANTVKANEVKVKLDVLKAKEEELRKLYED